MFPGLLAPLKLLILFKLPEYGMMPALGVGVLVALSKEMGIFDLATKAAFLFSFAAVPVISNFLLELLVLSFLTTFCPDDLDFELFPRDE